MRFPAGTCGPQGVFVRLEPAANSSRTLEKREGAFANRDDHSHRATADDLPGSRSYRCSW